MNKIAKVIVDMLNTEAMSSVHVSFGTIVNEIKEVSRSYKEAKMALDVGKIFYENTDIIAYSNLGIGRLIYQLPLPLCKMFIREIFDGKSPDEFDEETLTTINKFFENSLNVSETSRQLYIETRWCTDLISCRRAQDLTSECSRMQLHSRLLLW